MRRAVVLVLALAACDVTEDLGASAEPIIGGSEDTGHPAVVGLSLPGGGCSGTLIGDRTILTAAHCVDFIVGTGREDDGTVIFGTSFFDPDFTRPTARMVHHRRWKGGIAYGPDVAMIKLAVDRPPEIEPMAFNTQPLGAEWIGGTMTIVGFGNTDGEANSGFGTKRRASSPVHGINAIQISHGTSTANTCQGDSGGPGFFTIEARETVVGITSAGEAGCLGLSTSARVDAYLEDFVFPVYDAWEGPCRFDGECVQDCPRTPDPDCDPCGYDGFCAPECPAPDFDCPIGGFSGDVCNTDYDCESRRCVEALDDPRIKYCSAPCDPGLPGAQTCDAPLALCASEQRDEPLCYYVGITPGAQGSVCTEGGDCRSGVCDPDDDICIEECGDGLPACGEEFECRSISGTKACRLPATGGGCLRIGARGGAGAWPAGLALALLFVMARRARRRRV